MNKKVKCNPLPYADIITKINSHTFNNLSDIQLKQELKDCITPVFDTAKAYSIIKEIIRRKTGLILFDTQLSAAYSMQEGRIAELPTGEGKTLSAVVCAACFALQGRKVHILVFNDYLAKRDYLANKSIFEFCGLSCGFINQYSNLSQRKNAYSCDIVYMSAKEAGFDYLKNFLCTNENDILINKFDIALIDEADSILIDEARIPLVLAGNASAELPITDLIFSVVSKMNANQVELNKAENQVWLTDTGIDFVQSSLQLENLFTTENVNILAMVNAALEAKFLLQKDKHYIIKNSSIYIIDESTGRIAENRRFPDLLQKAVEAQEHISANEQTMIYNSISIQSFLSQYSTLCGMTGTAKSSAKEIMSAYSIEVDVIPPHIPCIRIDHEDKIFIKNEDLQKAVIKKIKSIHSKGQPILVGTQSIYESEYYSDLLKKLNIPHHVLNARNDEEEAQIIAQAGLPYRVTVSTNMAGRGVDIKTGGINEEQSDFVKKAGGLFVISTGINRSLRIDNQLRGRSGRQGDPGESQFFISLEDSELNTYFNIEYYKSKSFPKLLRRAQKIQEGKDAEARYMLEKYSNILEEQQKLITSFRTEILYNTRIPKFFKEKESQLYDEYILKYGEKAVTLAEKQLTLYYTNLHWANYLDALDYVRNGVHLSIVGGKNPLDEYQHFAVSAFDEMIEDIKNDITASIQKHKITDEGIDMEEAGLTGATTTWTYMINESTSQFNRIPELVKSMSNTIRGTVFSVERIFDKLKDRINKK